MAHHTASMNSDKKRNGGRRKGTSFVSMSGPNAGKPLAKVTANEAENGQKKKKKRR